MSKYLVYGKITGTKFLGEFEAKSEDEAIEAALSSDENSVGLCHYCSRQIELDDYSCHDAYAEEGGSDAD